jgi:hypothetical protein
MAERDTVGGAGADRPGWRRFCGHDHGLGVDPPGVVCAPVGRGMACMRQTRAAPVCTNEIETYALVGSV